MNNINSTIQSIFLITIMAGCHSFNIGAQTDYSMSGIGLEAPTATPEVFAPNIISLPDRYEFGSVFSEDGKDFYFGIDQGGRSEIHYTQLINGTWASSKVLISHSVFSYNDPMLSPDEQRLYFISDQSLDHSNNRKDIDIWYIERTNEGWSPPINAGSEINSSKNEYYISFTSSGKMYFSSNTNAAEGNGNNFDIYSSSFDNGRFGFPNRLSDAINTNGYEADVFISPDESYIIFCANRQSGYGRGDLYISFKDDNGNWIPAKNMGPIINSAGHELCPFVSVDGKYLFYTSNQDIYWVSTEVIQKLKTNTQ